MPHGLIRLVAGLVIAVLGAGCYSAGDQYGKTKDGPYDSYSKDAPGVDPDVPEVYTSDPGYHYQGQEVDSPQADMRK
jgi:hypothetical protein